jgi:RNA polymerase primary sigma factor|tara:strand:- start:18883 stop:19788 length:906 start_codon:yes stop_codon:yes gene_type:complete
MKRGEDKYYKDSDVMKMFYKDIKKTEVLSAEEQIELAIKAKAGDVNAMHKLCETNLRFVVSIAKEYMATGIALEDLVNEGNIGLISAIDRFDETRGVRFISYAVWWVRQSITKMIYEQGSNVRLPINKINAINKITKAKERLYQQLGREPSSKEIVSFINKDVSPEDMKSISTKPFTENDVRSVERNGNFEVSIDDKIDEESGASVGDMIAGDDFEVMEYDLNVQSLKSEISDVLGGLDERSSKIICMYFGINGETPMTLNEIGENLGLTNERVRQIKEASLSQLRTFDNSEKLRDFITVG